MFDSTILNDLKLKEPLKTRRECGKNDQCDHWAIPIAYYDHFVVEDLEYILFPPYNFNNFENILIKNNFKIVKNFGLIVAYKKLKSVEVATPKPQSISIATLFYDDSVTHLPLFFKHHQTIGVDKFFMYYNGPLSLVIDSLPKLAGVEYIEWNYPYYVVNESGQVLATTQAACLNTYMRKYGVFSDYNIFIDVDEYVLCKNLKTRLKGEQNHLFLDHRFAVIENNCVTYESTLSKETAGKMIINTKLFTPETIIQIHNFWPPFPPCDIIMAHNRGTWHIQDKLCSNISLDTLYKNE